MLEMTSDFNHFLDSELEERLVAMARGKHPFPSRTGQLSPAALMILGSDPGK